MFEQIGMNIFRLEIRSETLEKLSKLKAELASKHPNGNQLMMELLQFVTATYGRAVQGPLVARDMTVSVSLWTSVTGGGLRRLWS